MSFRLCAAVRLSLKLPLSHLPLAQPLHHFRLLPARYPPGHLALLQLLGRNAVQSRQLLRSLQRFQVTAVIVEPRQPAAVYSLAVGGLLGGFAPVTSKNCTLLRICTKQRERTDVSHASKPYSSSYISWRMRPPGAKPISSTGGPRRRVAEHTQWAYPLLPPPRNRMPSDRIDDNLKPAVLRLPRQLFLGRDNLRRAAWPQTAGSSPP